MNIKSISLFMFLASGISVSLFIGLAGFDGWRAVSNTIYGAKYAQVDDGLWINSETCRTERSDSELVAIYCNELGKPN